MSGPNHRRATYQDVLDAPPHAVAELIAGELHLSPRPGGPQAAAASALRDELGPPFRRGRGGPGGWILLAEPELHLARDVLVPDLAGWRRERMPVVEEVAYFTLPPDWVCEVMSRGTEKLDRARKLPIYAAHGVRHVWLVNPGLRMLEVLRLTDGKWLGVGVYHDAAQVRAEPFEAIELDLAALWADLAAPPPVRRSPYRACEGGGPAWRGVELRLPSGELVGAVP